MKTSEEIKKGLECYARPCGCDMSCPYVDMCREDEGCPMSADALAYIQQLEAKVPRWISVKERLPESYISVIGYLPIDDKEGLPPTREVYRTEKGWFAPSLGELCIVTHWMSMPEGFREV